METQIITLPAEVSVLASKVSENKQKEVQTILQQIFTGTEGWEKQVDAIEVKGIDDKMSIKLAEVARKNSKTARLSAEKIIDAKRDEVQMLKYEHDLEDKLWLKVKQIIQLKFKAIEEKAEWKANFVKRYEAEQKELTIQKRINEVSKYAEINRVEFEAMSDDTFESFLNGLKTKHEEKIETERIAEEQRIAKEKADAEAREQQRLENERLKAESEKREKEIEAERKLQENRHKELQPYIMFIRDYKALISKTELEYQKELIDIKKGAQDHWEYEAKERLRKEKEEEQNKAKLKAAQEAKAKLEKELNDKKQAELKAENDKKEAERLAKLEAEKLAKAPVKNQLNAWVDSFKINDLNLEHQKKALIIEKFEAFKIWAKNEINSI